MRTANLEHGRKTRGETRSARRIEGIRRVAGWPAGAAALPRWRARERELAGLAAARAPLRRALATLALHLVERSAWAELGFARLADYARERPGLSARQLQDLACTAHRLEALPAVDAAFRAGALPWTKARLVARAAARDARGAPLRLRRPRRPGATCDAACDPAAASTSAVAAGPAAASTSTAASGPETASASTALCEPAPAHTSAAPAGTAAASTVAAASLPRVDPAVEARWLARARALSADALEHEVRALDRASVEGGALEVDEDGRPVAIPRGVVLRCNPRTADKLHRSRHVARRVAGEKLPMWACMEATAAEAVSAVGLDEPPAEELAPEAGARGTGGPAAGPARTAGAGRAAVPGAARGTEHPEGVRGERALAHDAGIGPGSATARTAAGAAGWSPSDVGEPPQAGEAAPELPEVRALTADLADADALELDARLCRAVALEQRLEAELAPLLREATEGRLHRRHGFATQGAWVRERLGLSPRKARELVRLDRIGARCGALRDAFAAGRISWTRARPLLPLLEVPEVEGFRHAWVARAERASVRRLEIDVAAALHELDRGDPDFRLTGGLPDARARVAEERAGGERPIRAQATGSEAGTGPEAGGWRDACAEAERSYAARLRQETCRPFFTAPPEVASFFRAALASVRRHLERRVEGPVTEGEALEWMLDHAFATWGAGGGADDPRTPRAHRVFERDGWRCTVPGCSSYRNLHDHHVVFRSQGGSDALENRTTLCAFHHLRGVHGGRIRCRGRAPYGLYFDLGIRGSGPPLLRYGPGEVLSA